MKAFSTFRTILTAAALVIGCVSLPSHAQSQTMSVNVPFGFELGSRHFEPGLYKISTASSNIIMVGNGSNSAMALIRDGESSKSTKTAKVVFRRYGDRYFLRQVWFDAAANTYVECPESKLEKQAKTSELASNQTKAPSVDVAMVHLP